MNIADLRQGVIPGIGQVYECPKCFCVVTDVEHHAYIEHGIRVEPFISVTVNPPSWDSTAGAPVRILRPAS